MKKYIFFLILCNELNSLGMFKVLGLVTNPGCKFGKRIVFSFSKAPLASTLDMIDVYGHLAFFINEFQQVEVK